MNRRDVEIWLVRPGNNNASGQLRRLIETECNARGWTLRLRKTSSISSKDGRPLNPITPQDATNLYKRIHRARVGVWQVGDADVPIRPEPKSITRHFVNLRHFLEHKAFHARLPPGDYNDLWSTSLADFDQWLDRVACEGEGDPRCLPFHVFKTEFPTSDLATQDGRSAFAAEHGSQSRRIDGNQLHWDRPSGAFHGRAVLQVAGRDLVQGFHWDVSSRTNVRRITTTAGAWKIRPNGYVNVYPDQYVRLGNRASRLI